MAQIFVWWDIAKFYASVGKKESVWESHGKLEVTKDKIKVAAEVQGVER